MSGMKTENSVPHPHDAGYRHLLSSKRVFLELLKSFVKAEWVNDIDENSLFQMEGSFIDIEFRNKEADLIYRVQSKDQDIIFYLLMELQSTVDYFMPYRLLSYMVEIWRTILNNIPQEETHRKDFHLPAIVPMILYNGDSNWTAARNFKEILSGYEKFGNNVLDFSYILFDVNRYKAEDLKNLSNIIGSIFLLDQKYDIIELNDRLKSIANVLQNIDSQQFYHFTHWFYRIICSNVSKENLDSMVKLLEKSSPEEVDIVISNLGETIRKAQEEAERKGREEGIEKGIEEGIEKGIKKGERKKQVEIARNLISSNLSLELIAQTTGLSLEEVERLANEMSRDKD